MTICRSSCYLEGGVCTSRDGRSLHILGWAEHSSRGRPPSAQAQASRHYLEIMELDCDWLEEVVAALSCENPLWLDSRLVMEPLQMEPTKNQE